MVKFPTFRMKQSDTWLMDRLVIIERHMVTRALFDLFRKTIEETANHVKTKDIERILSPIAEQIKVLGKVVIADLKTHGIVKKHALILHDGLKSLNNLYPGACSQADEEEAIKQDIAQFQKYVKMLPKHSHKGEVLVHDMIKPGSSPISLPSFSKCKHVRRYLHFKNLAYRPELWMRYQDSEKQKHTPSGVIWEWLPQDTDIEGKHIEFISRQEGVSVGDYIVVLKCMKDHDPTEFAEPLDLAPLGSPCCSSKCGNLQAHLQTIWPKHLVIQALKIQDGADVLSETFDDNLFDPRTNSLYVYLE